MKNILSVETIFDDVSNNTYLITHYDDNSYIVKVYKKDSINNCYQFLGIFHLENNSLLSF